MIYFRRIKTPLSLTIYGMGKMKKTPLQRHYIQKMNESHTTFFYKYILSKPPLKIDKNASERLHKNHISLQHKQNNVSLCGQNPA